MIKIIKIILLLLVELTICLPANKFDKFDIPAFSEKSPDQTSLTFIIQAKENYGKNEFKRKMY